VSESTIQPLPPEKRAQLERERDRELQRCCEARLTQLQPAVRNKTQAQIHEAQAAAGAVLRDARSKIDVIDRILRFDDSLRTPPALDPAEHHRVKTFGQAAKDGDLLI
jgi:hypothetical protein